MHKYLVINKYQVDYTHLLGKGAMAKVYLGYYKSDEGDPSACFAVKEISINSSFIVTDSLLQEINLLRKMSHPFILKYIDAKKSINSLYLFIEYCDKGTLEDFVFEHKEGVPEEIMKRFIAQMVIALKFLKSQNIIHRDIKPKNILLHKDSIKVSDFGVAKIINNHNSDKETTTFSGTITFMSPQILKQEKYTFQTDIWSLGITIYFMVFQRYPWNSQKAIGILKEIDEHNGAEIPEGCHPLLRDLMRKMLMNEEVDRITIEQMKEHQYLKEEIDKLEKEIVDQEKTIESKEITKVEFMMNSLTTSDVSAGELERRSIEVSNEVRASQLTIDYAREAYRKLANFKEHIVFFKECLESLRAYHMKKDLLCEELFRKCEFLLVKRCYILAKDLHQILLFGTHTQGNIIIPKPEFTELIEGKNVYYKSLRSEVGRLYEEFKNQWLNTKESFYSYQRKQGIRMKPREDAFLENLVETPNLILAFNDCFLELFLHFSKAMVEAYADSLSEDIANSTILLQFGVKIEFVYDLMIVLCFPNVTEQGNLKNYKDKKKRVPCQEFIYRISIAYHQWKHRLQDSSQ